MTDTQGASSHSEVPSSDTEVPSSHTQVALSHTQVPLSHTEVALSHTDEPMCHTEVCLRRAQPAAAAAGGRPQPLLNRLGACGPPTSRAAYRCSHPAACITSSAWHHALPLHSRPATARVEQPEPAGPRVQRPARQFNAQPASSTAGPPVQRPARQFDGGPASSTAICPERWQLRQRPAACRIAGRGKSAFACRPWLPHQCRYGGFVGKPQAPCSTAIPGSHLKLPRHRSSPLQAPAVE